MQFMLRIKLPLARPGVERRHSFASEDCKPLHHIYIRTKIEIDRGLV